MNLEEMRAIVRRDLHDLDGTNYRWSDEELNRHISHAVKDLSEACPVEQRALINTSPGSRDIDISALIDLIIVEAVAYPEGQIPINYQRFSWWGDTITLLSEIVPDGSDAAIYYGALHTLDDDSSSIPTWQEELIVCGASGYSAVELSVYSINRVNTGGSQTFAELESWGNAKLLFFRKELKRLHRKNRVRMRMLYSPETNVVNQTTDFGP